MFQFEFHHTSFIAEHAHNTHKPTCNITRQGGRVGGERCGAGAGAEAGVGIGAVPCRAAQPKHQPRTTARNNPMMT